MHLLHNLYFALIGFLILTLIILLPLCRDLLSQVPTLAAKLQGENRIEGISYLFAGDAFKTTAKFWIDSQKVKGLLQRVHALTLLIRIMQIKIVQEPKLAPRAGEFYLSAIAQLAWTVAALPEALLCWAWPPMPHFCAQAAALWHVRITVGIQNEFFGNDTNESIGNLY